MSSLAGSRLLKVLVSAALIALLLWRLDLDEIGATLAGADWALAALGTGIFLLTNMVSVAKWRMVVRAQGQLVSYRRLTALFYIGLFFNNFLPTNFGGDVVKAYKLARLTGHPVDAAGSVVVDRATSTLALLLIAAVPALTQLRLLGTRLALLVLAMLLVAGLAVAFFASERIARRLGRFSLLSRDPFGIRQVLKQFYFALNEFGRRRGTLAAVMVISLAYQGLQIITVYVLALSLGITVSLIYYFLFIPIVLAVGMLPVSLNGLGVREGAWVILFGQVGVASAEAFSMSVLSFLVMTMVSLPGGVAYLFDRTLPASSDSTAESRTDNG